jgi:hypothetical protein
VSSGRRRILALVIAGMGLALGALTFAGAHPAAAVTIHCKHKPCGPQPTPQPTPSDAPPPTASPPASGQVEGISIPTATPYDDIKATPGPLVGTLITPQAAVAVPVAAPAAVAHPQAEPGLTALLVVAGVLAVMTLGAITVALALR